MLYVAATAGAGVRESFCGSVRFTDCEQLSFFSSSSSTFWFSASAMQWNALGAAVSSDVIDVSSKTSL